MALPILGAAAGLLGRFAIGAATRSITGHAMRAAVARVPGTLTGQLTRQTLTPHARKYAAGGVNMVRQVAGRRAAQGLAKAAQSITRPGSGAVPAGGKPRTLAAVTRGTAGGVGGAGLPGVSGQMPTPPAAGPVTRGATSAATTGGVAGPPGPPGPAGPAGTPGPPGVGGQGGAGGGGGPGGTGGAGGPGGSGPASPTPPPIPPGGSGGGQGHGLGGVFAGNMGGPLHQRGASFHEITRGLHYASDSLRQFTRRTRDATESLLEQQRHRSMFSAVMTGAEMQRMHATIMRDMRSAQTTGGSFAALSQSQTRREDAWAPFQNTAENIQNSFRSVINNVVAGMLEGVGEMDAIKKILEKINEALGKEEGDGTLTEKFFDHLKGVSDEARRPKAKRRT